MGQADLHIHSNVGDGTASIEAILERAEQLGLDLVAVTDHDTLEGSLAARELAARRNLRVGVVPGVEVTTRQGHLLALWVERPVASRCPLAETIAAVHRQGGACIVSHPMSWLSNSVSLRSLRAVVETGDAAVRLDGIETLNPTLPGRVTRAAARAFQRRHGLPQTGGSDAHCLAAVGSAVTLFEGRTGDDLRRALAGGRTRPAQLFSVRLADMELLAFMRQNLRSNLARRKLPLPLGGLLRNIVRR